MTTHTAVGLPDLAQNPYLTRCLDELRDKQALFLNEYDVDKLQRWDFNAGIGSLTFITTRNTPAVVCRTTLVGTLKHAGPTWRWAWADRSLDPVQLDRAMRLRALADRTANPLFTTPAFHADADTAWNLTAMSVEHLRARAAYRCKMKTFDLYLAIEEVRRP